MDKKETEEVSVMFSEKLPLVSVLMPAYNHAQFVERAVKSVWNQTYKNIELIVVDDGSLDGTYKVLMELRELSPIKFRLESQNNHGVSYTLNKCIKMAQGEWIATLASDDMYRSDYIETMVDNAVLSCLDQRVFHCDAIRIDEHDKCGERLSEIRTVPPLQGDAFDKILYSTGFIIPSTIFLSKKLISEVGGFDERLVAEDFDFHLRLARNASFHYINKPMFFSRALSGSLGNRMEVWSDDIFKSLEKHRLFIGDKYNEVVLHHHKRLMKGSAQRLSFKNSVKHYRCYFSIYSENGILGKKIYFIIVILREVSRGILVFLFPGSAVEFLRFLKHKIYKFMRTIKK